MAARTPLYERHVAAGARMTEFAGYDMPLQYTSIREEHLAVRSAAGMFDLSHMGEVQLSGSTAEESLLVLGEVAARSLARRQFYVANTRYRGAHRIYVSSKQQILARLQELQHRRRHRHPNDLHPRRLDAGRLGVAHADDDGVLLVGGV